ncbi:hypothetical protein FOMPIDRAFT_1053817 [Fomitopsis schrenkii]|uniref:L domain-like protein n=1 Tax=Fomitopsis schrenkii TaxID=2126942 RepID=S8FB86_FOMSC|nr:hypothetical protein FOMPIDRAFT_1053817 [Fomitopsis schrenkii]
MLHRHITDLSTVTALPKVEQVFEDHKAVRALDLSFGPCLRQLDASHDDITQLTPSALDERALAQLTALETLTIDHNSMRYVPASFGNLTHLLPGTKSLLGSLPTLPGDSWSQTFQSRNIMGWVLNFSALQIPSVNFPLYLFYLREVY